MIRVLFVSVFLLTSQAFPASLAVVGDIRGHVEPCGCNPITDLGGVFRLGGFVEKLQVKKNNPFPLLSVGNNFHLDEFTNSDTIILRSLEVLPLGAILLNTSEINHLSTIKRQTPKKLPFVLSNALVSQKIKGHVQDKISIGKDMEVYGFLSKHPTTQLDKALGNWTKAVQASKAASKILLFSGTDDDLRQIEAQSLFSVIISSSSLPFSVSPDGSEKLQPGKLLRLQTSRSIVRQTPLGGQGVLLFGEAQLLFQNLQKTVKALLAPSSNASYLLNKPNELPLLATLGTPIAWLDNSFDIESPLSKVQKDFSELNEKAFAVHVKKFRPLLKSSPYAGAEACKSCHSKAYDVWKSSRHANAHPTLVEVGKDKDLSCVTCHVVGLAKPGGFVSLQYSPQLAGVQCETCHGPRKEHAKNPAKKSWDLNTAKEVCTGCHHPPHSTVFNYESYFNKIKHP